MPLRSQLGLVAVALLAFAGGTWMAAAGRRAVPVGTPTAALRAPLVANGTGITTVGGPCDGVTVLDFFASWCSVCERSLPELERSARGVRWVSIGIDASAHDVRRTAARWKLVQPVAHDADGRLRAAYDVRMLPTLVVVAADGSVAGSFAGPVSASELEAAIAEARRAAR